MGSSLRRRGGTWWFRHRIPHSLVPVLDRTEVKRRLNASCFRAAQARAHEAWMATERVFADVAKLMLSQEQSYLILDRLRTEPVWQSPTALLASRCPLLAPSFSGTDNPLPANSGRGANVWASLWKLSSRQQAGLGLLKGWRRKGRFAFAGI
jgi:hypothetical protein